jgi:tRNA G18 (ribose-2'-O)-methylase SpoU
VNVIHVENARDSRLAAYASLGDARALLARGLFVAEGRFVVQRLLEAARFPIESLLLNDAALAALAPWLGGLEAPVYVCAPRFFEALTGHHFHRGCLALARRPPSAPALELARGARALLALDAVGNPDNVGSVFRSALAFGVGGVWLGPGTADPLSRKAVRTSMAASLRVPWASWGEATEAGWLESLARLRADGVELLALTPRSGARDLRHFEVASPSTRYALLIGSEGEGLSEAVLELASACLRIEMQSGVDSLNLGVAAGIALHHLAGAPGRRS